VTLAAEARHRILRLSPPRVLALGFLALIGFGAVLLKLPIATAVPISWSDALFTATSAVTVTGLVVTDTGATFTLFGEAVILVLIHIGGVGLMAFAVLSMLVAGDRPALRLRERLLIREALGQTHLGDLGRIAWATLALALACELAGTLFLWPRFAADSAPLTALWEAAFHAVSAFNNAGFSVFSDSLAAYGTDPAVNLTITALFIVGGIGFVVVADPGLFRGRPALHTRLMLRATAALSLLAMAGFWWLEHDNPATLGSLPPGAQAWHAWLHAVTPRTAGFSTLEVGAFEDSTALLTIWLMFIGGGSGSTAGGIKLTTFIVLAVATWAFLRQRRDPALLGRRLQPELVLRALAVTVVGMLGLAIMLLALTVTEEQPFLDLVFELVSACGTVGLSRGITAELSQPGRAVLMVAMFAGRVGPLTLAFSIATARPSRIRRAPGEVHVG